MSTDPARQLDDSSLDDVLRQWTVDSSLPPRFQEQVWNRIARAEASVQPSFWAGLVRLISQSFERPKVAYSYAAVLLALGVAAGSFTAQVKSNRLEAQLGQRYVLSVDPYHQPSLSR